MCLIRKKTEEEIRKQEEHRKLHEYYGLPLCVFAESEEPSQMILDYSEAIHLIACDKPIPADLEERLFKYKAENEKKEGQNKEETCEQ